MSDKTDSHFSGEYLLDLEKKIAGINALMDIFEIVSSTLNLNDLMNLVMEKAKSVTEADGCSILLFNKETNKLEFEVALCNETASNLLKEKITVEIGQGIAGWVAANHEPLIIDDVTKDDRFYGGADKLTGFITKSLSAFPLMGRRGLIGVVELINTKKKDYDLELFKIICRQFAIAIENALYYRESLERERVKQELKIAAEVQKSFLPQSPVLTKKNLTVSAVNMPALKVSGDVYDFVELTGSRVGVLIGDVSGKGISAALYMAKLISEFRHIALTADSPETALNRLNIVLSDAPRGMFLTAIYMIIDAASGKLRISAAGHPPFLLITKDGVNVMEVLSGPPLGILPGEYAGTNLNLSKGDTIIALTDGVFDAKNKKGERIGFEGLVEFVKKHSTGKQIVRMITDFVDDFSKGMERADDLTIVEINWTGAP